MLPAPANRLKEMPELYVTSRRRPRASSAGRLSACARTTHLLSWSATTTAAARTSARA